MKKSNNLIKTKSIIISIIVLLIMYIFICSLKYSPNNVIEYKDYITKSYENILNQEEFLAELANEIIIDEKVYTIFEIKEESLVDIDVKDIRITLETTMTTKDKFAILEKVDKYLEYSEDGYIGGYVLDVDSIQIEENYNGNFEYIEDKILEYSNLEKNDLDFIQKTIDEDEIIFELLNIEWEVETKKIIGESEVPNTYTALCTYGVVKEMDFPYTYTVELPYIGTAQKETGIRSNYEVIYEFKEIVIDNFYETFTLLSFILLSILSYFIIKYIIDLKFNIRKGKKVSK